MHIFFAKYDNMAKMAKTLDKCKNTSYVIIKGMM